LFNYRDLGNSRSVMGVLPQMSANLAAQRQISQLQKTGEFVLFYQPQYDMSKECVNSLEVLIRHKSYDGKITPPWFEAPIKETPIEFRCQTYHAKS